MTRAEHESRKLIFKDTMLKVFKHNIDAISGQKSYTQHINEFADKSLNEIVSANTGYYNLNESTTSALPVKSAGDYYQASWVKDWQNMNGRNVVGPVQNQVILQYFIFSSSLLRTALHLLVTIYKKKN